MKLEASLSPFRSRRSALFAGTTLAALLGGSAPVHGAILPTGFVKEPVMTNLFEPGRPVAFAELPDGRFLILERNTAQIRLVPLGGTSAPVIHTVPDVGNAGERGLLGVAIDPEWPARPYVYVHYTHVNLTVRVAMFTAVGDLSDSYGVNLQLTAPYDLLSDIPDLDPIHNGGTLRFGTDGMLYASVGDDADECNAQNLAALPGKILRLDVSAMPGIGSGPPPKSAITPAGNPYPGPGDNERLVWAWGLRNPFRFTIDSATNDVFIGDVGGVLFEEINRVSFASGAGENFGWPHREGLVDPGLGLACGATNPFTDPIYFSSHDAGVSIVAGPRYRVGAEPRSFPANYEGAVFVSEIWLGWARWIVDTGSGWALAPPVAGQPNAADWATGLHYIVDAQRGSDGALYVLQLVPYTGNPSGLYRIAPTPVTSAEASARIASSTHAFPNPASLASGTRITWTGGGEAAATVLVVNAAGRLVRTLAATADRGAGDGVTWDLRDANGAPVPSGMYVVSIRAWNEATIEGKVLVVR